VSERALLAVLLVTLIAMVTFDRPLVVGDGLAYLIWLDSIALDGDLDLANQAAKFAAVNTYHIYLNPETGRWASAFPLGVAFLLTPFYWLGSWLDTLPALRINDAHFVGIQGVPLAYSLCIMVGINVYALLMVSMGYGIARRFARPWAAAAGTIAVYLGTPLFFYTSVEPLNSHIAGGFAATLFTFLWLRVRGRPHARTWRGVLGWLWVGLAAGLTALCRWQVALIALPVGLEVLLRRRWREVVALGIGFAALAWIIPYSWWRMYGSLVLIPATQGDQSAVLIAPVNTVHVLFSPIAGLFPWSPIAALALVGLVPLLRRDGWLAASAAVMFLSQALVCGAVKNWWAGTGFGMRRMAELYPVYLFLLASLLGSVGVGLMRPGPVATHPSSGEHGGLGEHGGSPLRLFPFRRGLAVLVLVLTVVLALYGVALVLARLNFTWTNPWGLARDIPVKEMAYTFSREHWPRMWPVIKDHVGPWAWAKPGP
jgi:hypothetical protein